MLSRIFFFSFSIIKTIFFFVDFPFSYKHLKNFNQSIIVCTHVKIQLAKVEEIE